LAPDHHRCGCGVRSRTWRGWRSEGVCV